MAYTSFLDEEPFVSIICFWDTNIIYFAEVLDKKDSALKFIVLVNEVVKKQIKYLPKNNNLGTNRYM